MTSGRRTLGREDPEARCLPPGVPRMSTTPYPWSFLQTPKEIAIVYEGGAHIWRKIFMDGRPHDPKVEHTWLGDSIGHWEGDTLVVETVGQNDITWIDAAGIPHSSDMKVTERITRTDFGHMEIVHIDRGPEDVLATVDVHDEADAPQGRVDRVHLPGEQQGRRAPGREVGSLLAAVRLEADAVVRRRNFPQGRAVAVHDPLPIRILLDILERTSTIFAAAAGGNIVIQQHMSCMEDDHAQK